MEQQTKGFYTIKWLGDGVSMLDQRLLPTRVVYHHYKEYGSVALAIRHMEVRGAPAIGIAAAMGIALAAREVQARDLKEFRERMESVFELFGSTRPTAVNLFWTIDRMKKLVEKADNLEKVIADIEKESAAIYDEDREANRAMGKNGAKFIDDGDVVMTHCNAGALATGSYGTALGVIRAAVEEGKNIQVYACETRPFLQGARLTTWELQQDGIPVTLITDNMAAHFMKEGVIKKVVVGADRIAKNGDTANKIGTYGHSVVAKSHGIPFYIAAPISTLDEQTPDGSGIPIEERPVEEVAFVGNVQLAPEGIHIRNPAFDVTPAENISAIITEKGVVENPAGKGIAELLK